MDDFESIEGQVSKTKADYEAAVVKITGNRMMSQEGKQDQLSRIEAEYRATMGVAVERAAAFVTAERERAQADMRRAQAVAAQKDRELLGPQIVAEFLRADVAGMDGPEIVAAVKAAPDEWTRALLLQAGLRELRIRARAVGDPPERAYYDLEKLAADPAIAKMQARLQELRAYEIKAQAWNPDRERELQMRYKIR